MHRTVDSPPLRTFPISVTPSLQFDLLDHQTENIQKEGYGGGTEIKTTIEAQLQINNELFSYEDRN